ncbi:MAG: hypothetical protein M1831_000495 [Alyxoria varia]|nr:MAG: hypothetical protein M1831_000495 [Alyxoria varia]
MPPRLHPHSNYTTSLFSATLLVSFMVVGLPHLIPCPAPRTVQRAEHRPRRDQHRVRKGSDSEEGGESKDSSKEDVKESEPPWDSAGESSRSDRSCPVPKPGGTIGGWLGFPQPKERPVVRIESTKTPRTPSKQEAKIVGKAPSYEKLVVHDDHDFTLKILQFDATVHRGSDEDPPVQKTLDLLVRKSKIMTPSFSATLHNMAKSGFRESFEASAVLKDHNVDAVAIIFREWFDRKDPETLKTGVNTVWEILNFAQKYEIRDLKEKLGSWFGKWFASMKNGPLMNDSSFHARLLYPAFRFDHAQAFQCATRYLTYNEVHAIEEQNPTDNETLHLPRRVTHSMRSGKGRIRNVCHRGLSSPVKPFLSGMSCDCHTRTFFGYFQELYQRGIFPFEEEVIRNTMNELLQRMRNFDWEPNAQDCSYCRRMSYRQHVEELADKVEKHYHGLCLDCMDRTLPKTGSDDSDYWRVNDLNQWDKKCRVRHGECTWYHSFMGRKERRDELVSEANKRKQRVRHGIDIDF